MAFRELEDARFSRRAMLRGGAWLGAGVAIASQPFGRAAFAHDHLDSTQWANVQALIDQYAGSGKVANMLASLGFGQADATVLAKGSLSFGQPAMADSDSLYRIYSMTKPITGMATMMLIDDGKIGLDQPLAEILPGFANMQVLVDPAGSLDNTVPAQRPITIRHLLTHTAGLGYDIVSKGPLLKSLQQMGITSGQVSKLPIPGFPDVQDAPGLEAWTDRLATLPLIAQPGAKWSYSYGMDVLGRVIEVASGMSFGAFLQQRLFDPCGMSSTFFTVPQSEIGRLTTNYGILNGIPLPMDPAKNSVFADTPPIEWGGSALVSSPRDYDRFQRMLLGYGVIDGTRVMGELAVRVGTSNLLPEGADLSNTWLAGQQFGAAGRVQGKAYGWGGAAGTVAFVDFDTKLRASLFTQYMPADIYPVSDQFPKAVIADLGVMQSG